MSITAEQALRATEKSVQHIKQLCNIINAQHKQAGNIGAKVRVEDFAEPLGVVKSFLTGEGEGA